MLWIKAFHIIAMVTWFAGIFYLPRLFVYHAMSEDEISTERFKVMERKLYRGIMTRSAVVTVVLGLWLIHLLGVEWLRASTWLHVKLVLVALLLAYHWYLGRVLRVFARDANQRSHVFYRWINEAPVLILVAVVILAIVKPAI